MLIDLGTVKRKKLSVKQDIFRLDHSSWEEEYRRDLENKNIIMINDAKVIKEEMKANNDSLFDSRFNIPVETDNKIIEYSCDCERLIGRYNEGQICPECHTVVEIKYSIELLRRGWIDLEEYKIIVPAMYNKIRAFIGRKKLEEMILLNTTIVGIDPHKLDPSNPFKGIGLIEFERRYIEILEFFKPSSNRPELFEILIERKNIAFSSKIYVMSSAHRPAFISSKNKTFNYHNINALFVKILTDLNLIKRGRRTGRKAVEVIGNIQHYLMEIHDLAIVKLNGKDKLIRNYVISGKLWYSSRMVIISETSTAGIDCVRMSYKGFLGMFELEIMNAMLRGYGNSEFAKMTTAECRMYLTRKKYSNEIDECIFAIIQALINNRKDDGIWVIIDRNPSFDLGSLQCFKISDVFRDARKNVLTIPHNSLAEFNGDFDGDVLNVYSPKERCVVDAFKEGFRPSKLILDRSGGYYNSKMTPIKDEYAFIRSFCDSEYKPIDPSKVDLRNVEDILKDIKNPFNYKKVQALDSLQIYRQKIANGKYYDGKDIYECDPFDTIEHSSNKTITSHEQFDATDASDVGKKLNFDMLDMLGTEGYVECSKVEKGKRSM